MNLLPARLKYEDGWLVKNISSGKIKKLHTLCHMLHLFKLRHEDVICGENLMARILLLKLQKNG